MNRNQATLLSEVVQGYVPGFSVEQALTSIGKMSITIHHTFEVSHTSAMSPQELAYSCKELAYSCKERLAPLILASKPVAMLREEMAKKDAQIEALLKQNGELQRYGSYVEVLKEIAKAGAK